MLDFYAQEYVEDDTESESDVSESGSDECDYEHARAVYDRIADPLQGSIILGVHFYDFLDYLSACDPTDPFVADRPPRQCAESDQIVECKMCFEDWELLHRSEIARAADTLRDEGILVDSKFADFLWRFHDHKYLRASF